MLSGTRGDKKLVSFAFSSCIGAGFGTGTKLVPVEQVGTGNVKKQSNMTQPRSANVIVFWEK